MYFKYCSSEGDKNFMKLNGKTASLYTFLKTLSFQHNICYHSVQAVFLIANLKKCGITARRASVCAQN